MPCYPRKFRNICSLCLGWERWTWSYTYPWLISCHNFLKSSPGLGISLSTAYPVLLSVSKFPSQWAVSPFIFYQSPSLWPKSMYSLQFHSGFFFLDNSSFTGWFSFVTNPLWLQLSHLFRSFNDWQTSASLFHPLWDLEQTSLRPGYVLG